MGLFGKKKTPEEILAEGRALYEQGEYGKASLVLLKASGKLHGEVDYWLGRSYLAIDAKQGKAPGKTAKQYLKFAAEAGHEEAARLLSGQADAVEPGAADADVTADEAMDRGLKAYDRKDYVEAMSWWRKAEMLGSARATLMIGVLFSNGFGFPKDAAKGLQYFLKAAEQGVSDAQLYAAAKYESGADGVPQDLEKAVYWYEKAAEQGEAAAQHNLALLYANGRGTAQDYEKARYWLQKSAAQDEEVSEYSRGALAQLEEMMSKSAPKPAPKAKTDEELYTEGTRAYVEKNYAEAVQIWRQLAEKGMARAQDGLALLYYRGDGVEKDEKKSAEWYRKAAEQGHGSSCFNLAIFYERGIGVTKDLNEALRWAEKAKAVGAEKADNLIAEIRHNIEAEKNRKNLTKPSAPKPGDELSPEEQYQKGMELFRAGDYDGAYALLRRVCMAIGANKNDYPDGQAAMGWMYEHGCGVEEAKDGMAHRHYEIAARNGDKNGMAGFVRLTAKATSPSLKDCETALDYAKQLGTSEAKKAVPELKQKLSKAQKREMAEAEQKQREEELMRLLDEGVTAYEAEDYTKALYLFEKAAEQGDSDAQTACGELYGSGKGTAVDKKKALYWYKKAAEQGEVVAQFHCGFMYSTGEGTAVDKKKALYWYEKAAEQGDSDAQFNYGVMYNTGEGTAVDEKKALYWYEKAAEQGHATAQFHCGFMYSKGQGTAVDKKKALYWYEKAAEQGDATAQFNCGAMYSTGEGTAVDQAKALYWFEKSAEQGQVKAQFNCGFMYSKGQGTAVDKKKALYWYEKAAEQGHATAQHNCGFMYYNGEGTTRDKTRARAFFQKVAAQTEDRDLQEKAKHILRVYF